MSTRAVVVADTHAPSRWRRGCPSGLEAALASGPDLILHAGDVCTPEILRWLRGYAPVKVVYGNNDPHAFAAWDAEHSLSFDVDAVTVAMLHDSGASAGRAARMRRRFPEADIVVYGHSHIPFDQVDSATGLHLFNPGSPSDPRRQPFGTYGELLFAGGVVVSQLFRADDPGRRPLRSSESGSPTTRAASSAGLDRRPGSPRGS